MQKKKVINTKMLNIYNSQILILIYEENDLAILFHQKCKECANFDIILVCPH